MTNPTDEMEFLKERVMATRDVHVVRYNVTDKTPDTAIMLDHSEAGMSVIIVPSLDINVMHLEMHVFRGGVRVGYDMECPSDGVLELTIRT